ncbi:PREDICTED: trafficking kinesin-binding protein 2 [Nanorana parkeri]|uniref:trafficking kinesin-binding protein 2 n=1 Tax=Nanorana parkeri TaxID=125878 RepID=UPI0008548A75|nr:PREDICTED: trafficking kinesin-binding protein 2 [Nanorana parkeri]
MLETTTLHLKNKLMNIHCGDKAPGNEVYHSQDAPEMELVNMLEDQLPQYKLRVDSLYLYDHQDWIQSPTKQSNGLGNLSPVLAEETFRYMTFVELPSSSFDDSCKSSQSSQVLSSERIDQMTRSYNDTDMLSHLLAERDRDLELAARIGQALLKRNHILTEQNETLEEQLTQALDHVNQLQHELAKKDDLLRVVSIASEESETDSSCSTPLRSNDSFTITHGLLQLDNLHGKLRDLEEENLALRSKASHLKTETITYEEKEQQLVIDCVKEIRESNAQIGTLTEELSTKSEEIVQYHEQISNMLSQMVDLQHKLKESSMEKEELRIHLQASKEAQRQLTAELHELQDRNAECEGILQETQDELKMLRCKASPSALLRRPQSYSVFPVDSLAAEIEGTMRRELSLEEDSNLGERKKQPKRVFDTVKVANELRCRSSVTSIPGSNRSGLVMTALPFESGAKTEQKNPDTCPIEQGTKEKDHSKLGDNNLETALHRLHLRRQNYLSERQFFKEECERRLKYLDDERDQNSCRSPTGSVLSMSTHLSDFTDGSATSSTLRSLLPEKLQIVKPLEGSQTLHQWQQLAQPNLGTILDPRPGVMTKGFKPLPEDAEYHLCDLEEDEKEDEDDDDEEGITFEVQERKEEVPTSSLNIFLPPITVSSASSSATNPGKCLGSTNSTFTFTTCRILHPSDITQVTPSSMYTSSSFGSGSTSSTSTLVNSPAMSCRLSVGECFGKDIDPRLSSTSNLTKLLQEQGISAKVNSDKDEEKPPRPQNLLLPSTPPNSPTRSPCVSPQTFEPIANSSENFLAISRPAESFLQEMYGLKSTRNQADLGQLKINLVDRLKRLGIARVVSQPGQADQVQKLALNNGLKRQESAMFVATSSSLLGGLRRNQSLPAIIGGLAAPACTYPPKMGSLKEDLAHK